MTQIATDLRADRLKTTLLQLGEQRRLILWFTRLVRAVWVWQRFGAMYRAFHFGAPPHGGMAAGVDRIIMLLAGEKNLREVTLFPMNQQAEDLLMGAPSEASSRQLQELHVRLHLPKK